MSQGQFFDLISRVDDILRMQDVRSVIPELHNLLQNASVRKYFFENLHKAEWLQPLADSGFFATIPSLKRDSVKNTLEFPLWPESRFLARMASVKPDLVLDIIKQIPDTDNTRVYEDFADAALKMPPELAVRLLEKAKKWACSPYQLLLPKKLGSLAVHLATGGQIGAALELAGVLLEVIPDTKGKGASKKEETYSFTPEPSARFDTFYYAEIIKKHFPELLKAGGVRALSSLCDLLESAIRFSRREHEDKGPEDYSHIWRPAIENHPQNPHHGIKDILVTGVRDGLNQLVESDFTKVPEYVRLLEERRWRIFHRLSLHLLRLYPDAAPNLVASRLTDRRLFDDDDVRHEYALLADKNFGKMTHAQQQIILNWIDKGPELQSFKESHEQWTGKPATDEDAARYKGMWQRDRLAWFKAHLPEEWKKRYEELVAKYGGPSHPEFTSITTSWVGPTSPKTANELQAMPVTDIVEYLKSWQPPGDWMASSPEGLGRLLSSIVAENPAPFSAEAVRFQRLDPTYIRAVLTGFREALKQQKVMEWSPVFTLCLWVVDQNREIPGRNSKLRGVDPDWGWARKSIASLISAGFEEGTACIPFDQRAIVWRIIHPLTNDPDPAFDREAGNGDPGLDAATLAINTVRGEAMHAAIHYALWIYRHLEKLPDFRERLARGFNEMPEVREVLDEHLDISKDPSLAIRAVYGQWLPWLVLLDPVWTKEHIASIFPGTESERSYRDAAWETYIIFCAPYDNVFEIMGDQYAAALDRLGKVKEKKTWIADPGERLAEHLMFFYWRGKLAVDGPRDLLNRFWSQAPESIRAHALGFIGRKFESTKETIPAEILQRLQFLWEQRLSAAKEKPNSHKQEMAAFGWWFISGKFEDSWIMAQLIEALKISGKMEISESVVERLASFAQPMPYETVKCLELLVKGDRDGWDIDMWRGHARIILASALQSGNKEASATAESLIHYLGSLGYLEFRDLLKRG
jgi:hypothetical protein